jgi:hypothetical protein
MVVANADGKATSVSLIKSSKSYLHQYVLTEELPPVKTRCTESGVLG